MAIAEYMEFEMLPTMIASAAQAVLPGVPGKAEWTPAKFSLDIDFVGLKERLMRLRGYL